MIAELTPVGPLPVEQPYRHRRSVSQLTSYLKCPEGYRLEKIAKAPSAPAAWLTQGVAFHEAIEKWEGTGRHYPLETVLGWYDTAWDRILTEQLEQEPNTANWITGGRTKPQTDIENRFQRGRQQVEDYVNWALSTADKWRVLEAAPDSYAVEVPFEMILGSTRVVGFIDQVIEWRDGSVTVRDLKTGTKLPHGPRQLGVYRLALAHEMGIDVTWGDYFMSKNCAPTEPYNLTRYTPERVGRWFDNLDRSVMEGRFTPNPGDHCRICPVKIYCDEEGIPAFADQYSGINFRQKESNAA